MLDSNENPQYHVKFAYVMDDEIREKEIIVNAQSIGKAKINAHNKMRELGYKGFTMKDISSVWKFFNYFLKKYLQIRKAML